MNKHNGSVDLVGHFPLGSFGDIITVDVGCTVFFVDTVFGEVLDGVSVIESHEWSLRSDKVWVEGLDDLSSDRVGKEVVDDITDDALEVIKQVFESDKDELGFEMGVLGQVSTLSVPVIPPKADLPSCQTLFGSETFLDTVDISQTWQHGLEVQLTGLGQVCLGAIVVEFEQGRSTLDRGLDQTWGSDFGNSSVVESFSERSK